MWCGEAGAGVVHRDAQAGRAQHPLSASDKLPIVLDDGLLGELQDDADTRLRPGQESVQTGVEHGGRCHVDRQVQRRRHVREYTERGGNRGQLQIDPDDQSGRGGEDRCRPLGMSREASQGHRAADAPIPSANDRSGDDGDRNDGNNDWNSATFRRRASSSSSSSSSRRERWSATRAARIFSTSPASARTAGGLRETPRTDDRWTASAEPRRCARTSTPPGHRGARALLLPCWENLRHSGDSPASSLTDRFHVLLTSTHGV